MVLPHNIEKKDKVDEIIKGALIFILLLIIISLILYITLDPVCSYNLTINASDLIV